MAAQAARGRVQHAEEAWVQLAANRSRRRLPRAPLRAQPAALCALRGPVSAARPPVPQPARPPVPNSAARPRVPHGGAAGRSALGGAAADADACRSPRGRRRSLATSRRSTAARQQLTGRRAPPPPMPARRPSRTATSSRCRRRRAARTARGRSLALSSVSVTDEEDGRDSSILPPLPLPDPTRALVLEGRLRDVEAERDACPLYAFATARRADAGVQTDGHQTGALLADLVQEALPASARLPPSVPICCGARARRVIWTRSSRQRRRRRTSPAPSRATSSRWARRASRAPSRARSSTADRARFAARPSRRPTLKWTATTCTPTSRCWSR